MTERDRFLGNPMMLVSTDVIFRPRGYHHSGEKRTAGYLNRRLKAKGADTLGQILALSLDDIKGHNIGKTSLEFFTAQLGKLGYAPEELLHLRDDIEANGVVETLSLQDLKAPLDRFVEQRLNPPVAEGAVIGSILLNHIITRLPAEDLEGFDANMLRVLSEHPEIRQAFAEASDNILKVTGRVLQQHRRLKIEGGS